MSDRVRVRHRPQWGVCRLGVALVSVLVTAAACQTASVYPASTDTSVVDDGTTITMWTRSVMATFSGNLIDEYNATHRNKVKLTVMPADSYQQRVGAAA